MRCLLLMSIFSLPLAQSAAAETLRVLANDTRPFFYVENETPAGLEYDILTYFADAEGHELEIHWIETFADILPMLERGEGDIAAATLTITPARQARFDFSESYFPVRIMLVEPIGEKTTDLRELAGETLATLPDSTYEAVLSTVPNAKLIYAGNDVEMYELVASGKARALASDSAVAFEQLKGRDSLQLGMPLSDEQQYGFALRKGSPLTKALSDHILQLKASGIYFRLLEQYMGAAAVDIVKSGRVK